MVERGVQAHGVVEALDEGEDRHAGLRMGGEAPTIEQLALLGERPTSVAKTLSHIALSWASPTEPMEGRTPASRQRLCLGADT